VKTINRKRATRRDGVVLYMALLVLIPVAALAYGLLQMGASFNSERLRSIEDEQALFLADAGLAESILALRNGGTGRIGTAVAPVYYGRGLLWVDANDVGNDLILLRSTAMYEGGRRSVESLVFRDYADFRGMTIFSSDSLTIDSQCFLDSFDSNDGSYDDQFAFGFVEDGAIVESNGSITIDSSVELHGDAHPGPGFDVDVPGSSDLTGNQQPNESTRSLPPVTVPVIAPSGALLVAAHQTLSSGDYNFSSIDVDTGADLEIRGPARIVVDDFDLRSNTNLIIDTANGPVEFYISGNFVQASNSTIDVTGKSATLLTMNFVGDSTQVVELKSNSDFYGVIYAPEATVIVHSNFEIFGAVVANNIELNSNVQIHYDEALIGSSPAPLIFTVATWNLAEFPVREFLLNRSDPFSLVGIPRGDLALAEEGREVPVP
jgi:hypothetical protein